MFVKLIDIIFEFFKLAIQDISLIVKVLSYFEQLATVVFDAIGTALPELLAGVVLSSVFFIVALKIIQFH